MENKKNKALFVVSPYYGGASRMTINISNLLNKEKFDVFFLCYGPQMYEIEHFLPSESVVECLNICNIWDFATFKIIKILKKYKITHVFCSFAFMSPRIILAAKWVGGIKIIQRCSNSFSYFSFINRVLLKWTFPMSDVVIAQQEEMAEELIKAIPKIKDKICILHNILDKKLIDQNIKEESPYPKENQIRYIWTGRITYTKGYDVLLKAFNLVRQYMPEAHLYLLGKKEDDMFYKNLQTYIVNNNLTKYVHFEGLLTNPHVWIKNANCFVLPSRLEGLPNSLIEAMYIGVPVVCTRCVPIIDRIVKNGYNGYVVSSENYRALADAMVKALNLQDFEMTYKSSSPEDFRSLFD